MNRLGLGHALRAAREDLGLTQAAVGRMGLIGDKMVSAVETDRKQPAADVVRRIAKKVDHPRLYMAAAAEQTGGVFVGDWLDGVDLHRTAVALKGEEELSELKVAYERTKSILVKDPSTLTSEDKEAIQELIQQTIDVQVWAQHKVSVLCMAYGLSIGSQYDEHKQKLTSRGYRRATKKSAR